MLNLNLAKKQKSYVRDENLRTYNIISHMF